MSCKCARPTDEWHGWECSITDGPCMYFMPDSKQCAKDYGEGPDAEHEDEEDEPIEINKLLIENGLDIHLVYPPNIEE